MQKNIKQLRVRFVLIITLIVAIVIGAVFLSICTLTRISVEESGYAALERIVNQPMQFESFRPRNNEIQLPYLVLDIDSTDGIIASYGNYYDINNIEALSGTITEIIDSDIDMGYISQYELRFIKSTKRPGLVTIALADVSGQMNTLRQLNTFAAGISIAAVVVFSGISIILSKWVIKPVETAWVQQTQFVSDASHELKTPLTVISTNAELLKTADCSEEDRLKYTNNIVTVSHQMRTLVEDMLNLARVEKGESATYKRLSLSDICNDVLMQFEPVMFEKNLELEENVKPDVFVKGSVQRLSQLVTILLDNAGKYATGGSVKLELKVNGRNAALCVSNQSEPLSPDQLKNIFKRFYRTDEARSTKESFGLGLAIAKGICESHNGDIHAEYKDGVVYFTASIPIA